VGQFFMSHVGQSLVSLDSTAFPTYRKRAPRQGSLCLCKHHIFPDFYQKHPIYTRFTGIGSVTLFIVAERKDEKDGRGLRTLAVTHTKRRNRKMMENYTFLFDVEIQTARAFALAMLEALQSGAELPKPSNRIGNETFNVADEVNKILESEGKRETEKKIKEFATKMEALLAEREAAAKAGAARRKEAKTRFEEIKIMGHVSPRGGERGTDGWHEGIYRHRDTGETAHMVSKDIFDFGAYSFPVRLSGTPSALSPEQDGWTETEKACAAWLERFGPFGSGIRF
jgi:hypothetical protein